MLDPYIEALGVVAFPVIVLFAAESASRWKWRFWPFLAVIMFSFLQGVVANSIHSMRPQYENYTDINQRVIGYFLF